jgi:hypothetical protein
MQGQRRGPRYRDVGWGRQIGHLQEVKSTDQRGAIPRV